MTKQRMFEYFRQKKATGQWNYFYIRVKTEGQSTLETILNDFEALEFKLNYMETAYADDLKHNHAPCEIYEYGVYNSAIGIYNSSQLEVTQ